MRPVFVRELLISSRQLRYSWVRVGYTALLLTAVGLSYATALDSNNQRSSLETTTAVTTTFFNSYCWLQLILVSFMTPAVVSGVVASERERRTMEYLLTSCLSDSEIILDKFAARLIQLTCLVLAGLPVMAIAMMIGGISPVNLAVATVVSLSTLMAFSALSVLVSVWSRNVRAALARSYLLIGILALPPIVLWLIPISFGASFDRCLDLVLIANPYWFMAGMTAGVGPFKPLWVWLSELIGIHMALSVLSLAVAVRYVRRVSRRVPVARERRRHTLWHSPAVWERAPLLWKEFFMEGRMSQLGRVGTVLVSIGALAVMGGVTWIRWNGRLAQDEIVQISAGIGTIVGCFGLMAVGARAAGVVTSEKQQSSWTSLLSTPLTARAIVVAKVFGNVYACKWILLVLCYIWILPVTVSPRCVVAAGATIVCYVGLMTAVSVLGVVFSLWCSNSLRAVTGTVIVGFAVTVGYLFVTLPFAQNPSPMLFAPCVPFLIGAPLSSVPNQTADWEVITALLMGYLWYGISASVMAYCAVKRFRALTGRMEDDAPRPAEPSPGNAPVATASR